MIICSRFKPRLPARVSFCSRGDYDDEDDEDDGNDDDENDDDSILRRFSREARKWSRKRRSAVRRRWYYVATRSIRVWVCTSVDYGAAGDLPRETSMTTSWQMYPWSPSCSRCRRARADWVDWADWADSRRLVYRRYSSWTFRERFDKPRRRYSTPFCATLETLAVADFYGFATCLFIMRQLCSDIWELPPVYRNLQTITYFASCEDLLLQISLYTMLAREGFSAFLFFFALEIWSRNYSISTGASPSAKWNPEIDRRVRIMSCCFFVFFLRV